MIKATVGNTVILGLSEGNVKKLKEKAPIFIKGSDINIPIDIAIVYGETELSIMEDMEKDFDFSKAKVNVDKK